MKMKVIFCVFCMFLIISISNIVCAKYVIEESGIIAKIQIDRTAPNVEVNYSINEITSQNVEVTIKANEEIQELDGWVLQEDKKTLKKKYIKNTQEEINVKDLVGNITKQSIIVNNIDKELPIIDIIKISNSNTDNPNYANKDAKITFTIAIKDNIKIEKTLEENDIKILVDNKEVTPKQKTIIVEKDTEQEKQILLIISGIEKEGKIILKIPKDVVKDKALNSNLELEKDIEIKIDNTSPQAIYSQNKLSQGKIEAKITANEEIRKLDGWNLENKNVLKKIFNNNLSYITTIKDLAGNSASVEVNVIGATNVIISYASHNSEIGWSYGYGNYDIAGIDAIKRNAKYKTESLALSISGNVEKDFMQAKVYVHTHWKEGKASICNESNQIYYHGWNPSENEWSTLLSKENIILEGKNYIQFGGTGINHATKTDTNGNDPIPVEIANEYKYGISGIQLKLKSYEYYSIVYQIYIDGVGWIKPAKNGEIECYKEDKPMSAIRITLVPNSEVDEILKMWDKDTRKIHLSKKEKSLT